MLSCLVHFSVHFAACTHLCLVNTDVRILQMKYANKPIFIAGVCAVTDFRFYHFEIHEHVFIHKQLFYYANTISSSSSTNFIATQVLQKLHGRYSCCTCSLCVVTEIVLFSIVALTLKTLNISQGSVATHLRCGGIFSYSIITHFLLILTVK